MVRAADAAAQLVQLRQAEAVGAIDDDRVGGRHVDAALDDRRAKQHVEAPVVEVEHDLFEFAFRHLAVADADAGFGNQLLELLFDATDVLDAVVDEIHLAAALDFAQAGFADHDVVPLGDERLDREALGRWRRDQGHFAQAAQRHVQRSRDRRRGQRQDVDFAAQRLDGFLVANAEAVFLVDDDEPDIVKSFVCCSSRWVPMTTSTRPIVARNDVLDLLGGLETRQHLDAHRPVRETVRKFWPCCWASSVVGTSTATCLPPCTAANVARSATSVLPKPTSPQTTRSMGWSDARSSRTSSIVVRLVFGQFERKAGLEGAVVGFGPVEAMPGRAARRA